MATSNADFRQTLEFRRGRTAEELVTEELKRRGWFVNVTADYVGVDEKAPRLHGPHEVSWILPDLDVCRAGVRRWVEVKYKSRATRTKVEQRRVLPDCELEHGIDLRLVRHYRRVQAESGCKVWVCIYEGDTRIAWMQALDRLDQPDTRHSGGRRWHRITGPGEFDKNRPWVRMFIFSRADLIMFATLDPVPFAAADRDGDHAPLKRGSFA